LVILFPERLDAPGEPYGAGAHPIPSADHIGTRWLLVGGFSQINASAFAGATRRNIDGEIPQSFQAALRVQVPLLASSFAKSSEDSIGNSSEDPRTCQAQCNLQRFAFGFPILYLKVGAKE
jgi:hypothetical protein